MIRMFSSPTKIALLLILILLGTKLNAQGITSKDHGSWTNPATWDCSCIPGDTDVIVIKHNVTLSLGWIMQGGSIYIDLGASLEGNNFLIKDGAFTNLGAASFVDFAITGGTMINYDTLIIDNVLINETPGTFWNLGLIARVDTFYNYGDFLNDGEFISTFFYNDTSGYFNNKGVFGFIDGFNLESMTNSGLIIARNFVNAGEFTNEPDGSINLNNCFNLASFTNHTAATMHISNDFWNGENPPDTNIVFRNDGFLGVGNDWKNFGKVEGKDSGQICVGGTSINTGTMNESFDFCDTSSIPPLVVDYNFWGGTIDSTITSCDSLCKLYASVEMVNPTCYNDANGEISINVIGGKAPYTYSAAPPYVFLGQEPATIILGPNQDSLSEGVYIILVKDSIGDSLFHLAVLYTPPLEIEMSSTASCTGGADGSALVSVFPATGNAPYTYIWSNGDVTDSSSYTSNMITGLNAGDYNVTVTDSSGCDASGIVIIDSMPNPIVNGFIERTSCPYNSDGSIALSFLMGDSGYVYIWNDSNAQTGSTAKNLAVGTYTVTITDTSTSCSVIHSFLVESSAADSCKWKIYNGFTPNDDNIDDFWRIRGLEKYENVVVRIFNNRGIIVWETADYQNNWDGTDYKGTALPEGIYYYIVQREDKFFRGWVSLLR